MEEKLTYNELEQKVAKLESQLEALKSTTSFFEGVEAVNVPKAFKPTFDKAEKIVGEYFKKLILNPNKGTIEVDNQRYVLVRAAALSSEFFSNIVSLYADKTEEEAFNEGKNFLFDIGHMLGMEDARQFHKKMRLKDPIEKLSAGPVHFAYSGWAFVDILPESNPSPDETFFLKYRHPYSFEADSWIKSRKKAYHPVCIMNAAYSSGWCEESFGMPLTAVEISCKAMGDENCTFIMAPPHKIQGYLDQELSDNKKSIKPSVPFFFERKKVEDSLRQSEKMLSESQAIAKIGSWSLNLQTRELIGSKEFHQIFELESNPELDIYQEYLSKFIPEELTKLKEQMQYALDTGNNYQLEHCILLSEQRKKWIHCTGIPVFDNKGEVTALKGIVQDITEKIQTKRELENFFDLSVDLLCIANQDGYFLKISPSWSKLLGYTNEELCNQPYVNFVHPDDLGKTHGEMENLNEGTFTLSFENRYRCKNGEYVTLSWNAIPDKVTGLIYCVARDVTKQKQIEHKLKTSVREKEILLKEIHHRVKNNLQVISSLLSLQSNLIKSEKIRNLFDDSRNRIKSMAALHELLYQAKNFDKIDYQEYLEKLLSDLMVSFRGISHNIKTIIQAEGIRLNLDTAVPLSLIINEILTNALKHGIVDLDSGEIYILLRQSDHSEFILEIGDDGKGYAADLDFHSEGTLGLMLIDSLTDQLEGVITRDTAKKGTHYKLKFKEQRGSVFVQTVQE